MKELKNKVDSIRRSLKSQNITVTSAEIENKILELCPDFPDDWCDDVRREIIKALVKDNQTTELAPIENVSNLQNCDTIADESNVNNLDTDVNTTTDDVAIAPLDKSELVATTAQDMGITLSIDEVMSIAENFDDASQDSDYEISQIESAIITFVRHKAQVTKQKITNMVDTVRETVNQLDNENSQLLNDGLREINNDIKSGSQRFKSQVRTALKAFALPHSKAG